MRNTNNPPAAFKTASLMAVILLASTGAVMAHPWFIKDKANANSEYSSVLNIPHGCDANGTIKLTMKLPKGITGAKAEAGEKWKSSTKTTATGASLVIWEGGPLPSTQNGEFKISFKIGDVKPGQIIYFPIIQNCEKGGNYRWIEMPSATVDEYDLETPAPLIEIVAGDLNAADSGRDKHGRKVITPAPGDKK